MALMITKLRNEHAKVKFLGKKLQLFAEMNRNREPLAVDVIGLLMGCHHSQYRSELLEQNAQ